MKLFKPVADRAPLLVFVGERRSGRAIRLNVTWLSGRLAGKTLHDALRAAGLTPEHCVFVNLLHDDPQDGEPCGNSLQVVRSLGGSGATIVGLGRCVQGMLRRADVAHISLTHPAARGAIRARAAYQRHVRDVLMAAGVLRGEATRSQDLLRRRSGARST